MKFHLAEFLILALILSPRPTLAATIPAAAPDVLWEGRTFVAPDQSVSLAYPAVTVHLRFRGDRLAMRAQATTADVSFDVLIDEDAAQRVRLPAGEATTLLWEKKGAAGEHDARIVHRTESWMGICTVSGFETSDRFLQPLPLPERKLLFIGDSFTCGASTEVVPGVPMEGKTLRQNARLAYGRLLADRLEAQCQIVAYAGRGIFRDWQGRRDLRYPAEYYKLALPDDPTSLWNPQKYTPDAIGVCLGTNDFDEGIPDQTDYINRYCDFVRELRHDAPKAYIFLLDSPILRDVAGEVPKHSVLHAYLGQVVRKLGDARVSVVAIPSYPIIPNDGHPDGSTHRAVAAELEPIFRSALNWK